MTPSTRWFVLIVAVAAVILCACGSSARAKQQVLIEPIETATPQSLAAAVAAIPRPAPTEATGGKPAAPPTPVDAQAPGPTAVPATATAVADERPTEGKWIEVDVTKYVVRLMDGDSVVQTIAPVAVGAQVDTGAYESTQTGLFHVYNKAPGLAYDAPYKTYISDWVGFDPDKANGFHSFLKDKDGNVVDDSTGRVSNGCIRTGDAAAITAFAAIGMPVWVHA